MKTITAGQVRAQLTSLLAELSDGPIAITKHGKTIAILCAPDALEKAPSAPAEAATAPVEAAPAAAPAEPTEAPPEAATASADDDSEEDIWSEPDTTDDTFEAAFARAIEVSDDEAAAWDDETEDEAWDSFMASRTRNKEARRLFRI